MGLYILETAGYKAHKRVVDSFINGSLLEMPLNKLPESVDREIFEARKTGDANRLNQVIHEELRFDGVAHIYTEEQHLMLYGSKYGHVFHFPIVRYKL